MRYWWQQLYYLITVFYKLTPRIFVKLFCAVGHQHAAHLKEKICWSDAFYRHSFSQVCGTYLLNVDRHVQESVNKKFCKRCSYVVGSKKFSRARLSRSLLAKRHFLLLLMFSSLNTSCLCLERNRPMNTGVWLWIQNAVVKWCFRSLYHLFSVSK